MFAFVLGLALCPLDLVQGQQTDEQAIAGALGPQWKQLSHRAGVIFAGTVLAAGGKEGKRESFDASVSDHFQAHISSQSSLQVRFRIDEPITGTGANPGEIFTIHEWSGAWSLHRPLQSGQRVLIFLYPLSRLGFTSPVGGSQGVLVLDPSGKYVSAEELQFRKPSSSSQNAFSIQGPISVAQLKRALRRAREE